MSNKRRVMVRELHIHPDVLETMRCVEVDVSTCLGVR